MIQKYLGILPRKDDLLKKIDFALQKHEGQIKKYNQNNENFLFRVYGHESNVSFSHLEYIKNILTNYSGFEKKFPILYQDFVKILKNDIKQLNKLEKVLKLGTINGENIFQGHTNFEKIFEEQYQKYNLEITERHLEFENDIPSKRIKFNPLVATPLISTLIGNSIKYSPRNSTIYLLGQINKKRFEFFIENQIQKEAQLNGSIGLGEEFGSEMVKKIIKTSGGKIQYYDFAKVGDLRGKVWGSSFSIPIK